MNQQDRREMMVIYEVTSYVDPVFSAEFEEFITEYHISDVLSTGYFTRAIFLRAGSGYQVQYITESIQQVEEYTQFAAPTLRNDFLGRFPTGVKLSRENWEVISTHDQSINR